MEINPADNQKGFGCTYQGADSLLSVIQNPLYKNLDEFLVGVSNANEVRGWFSLYGLNLILVRFRSPNVYEIFYGKLKKGIKWNTEKFKYDPQRVLHQVCVKGVTSKENIVSQYGDLDLGFHLILVDEKGDFQILGKNMFCEGGDSDDSDFDPEEEESKEKEKEQQRESGGHSQSSSLSSLSDSSCYSSLSSSDS
jgi:hypothetical protein